MKNGRLFFASLSFSSLLPQIITLFPRSEKLFARARPIPVPPPVINTVFPEVFIAIITQEVIINIDDRVVWINGDTFLVLLGRFLSLEKIRQCACYLFRPRSPAAFNFIFIFRNQHSSV